MKPWAVDQWGLSLFVGKHGILNPGQTFTNQMIIHASYIYMYVYVYVYVYVFVYTYIYIYVSILSFSLVHPIPSPYRHVASPTSATVFSSSSMRRSSPARPSEDSWGRAMVLPRGRRALQRGETCGKALETQEKWALFDHRKLKRWGLGWNIVDIS